MFRANRLDRTARLRTILPLPETIPTKISSEAAGYVSMTPVARREMPIAELVEQILALTGKNVTRIREILSRGTLVRGPSRYRWESLEVLEDELAGLLNRFPDPEPERPFEAAKCTLVVVHGQRGKVALPREVASQKRLFKRQSFWNVLLPAIEELSPRYSRYSYSDRADVYVVDLPLDRVRELQGQLGLLKYTSTVEQLQYVEATSLEAFVRREP